MSDLENTKPSVEASEVAADGEVGYGRPPKAGQFRKGASGNPKGRPQGSKNTKTLIKEMLASEIDVTVNGALSPEKMTLKEAVIRQLGAKAANGHFASINKVLAYAEKYEDEPVGRFNPPPDFSTEASGLTLDEEFEAILDQIYTDGGLNMTTTELLEHVKRYDGTDAFKRWRAKGSETDDAPDDRRSPEGDQGDS